MWIAGSPEDNGCLQNIACQQPEQAKKYAAAGDVLLKATKMFNLNPDDSYSYVLQQIEQSANVGMTGGDCTIYKCNLKET